jgi:glutathione peroxidase
MLVASWLLAASVAAATPAPMAKPAAKPHAAVVAPKAEAAPLYGFALKRLDGTPTTLAAYKGKVLLIVNTASKCGNTPQYAPLEKLHETYAPKGLAVLGFPANDFLFQEPGSNDEIHAFCTENYGVTFDMFEKSVVKGEGQSPLYRYLTAQPTAPKPAGDVSWNFEKFLVDRHGHVVARFAPRTQPNDPAVVQAIEAELAKP